MTAKQTHEQERQHFLDRLVAAREQKRFTQTDLAKKVHMSQPAIARIESGKGNPTLKALLVLAKALDTELRL